MPVPDAAVTVELLGPVRVLVDAAPLAVGGPRPRALVARLALTPRVVVPAPALAAALWGEQAPPSASQTLRTYASRMRSGPLGEVLHRDGPGWLLDLPDAAVDALRLAAVLQAAQSATAAEQEADLLRQALGLWRGEPLADVRDAAFAADEARRLTEARASARERLVELRLAAGEHRSLVAELTALVAEQPHREAPALMLATALARSGRVGDAAAELAALRQRLTGDLGLDPSPSVDALQQQLLVHDPAVLRPPALAPVVASSARQDLRPASTTPLAGDPAAGGSTLPLPLTPFVGRAAELAVVAGALQRSRLVTLTGPGGSGKTRLALEALRRLDRGAPSGPEAIWLVELGGLSEPGLLLDTVAQALGVVERSIDDAVLVRALDGRRTLLVLDTCEHLADAVAHLVERLLAGCTGLQVLTTSREALGLAGETVLPVPPLVPAEALALFAQRAQAAAGRPVVDDRTSRDAQQLVRALDGIPLALELAAARLSVLALDDVVGMLDDRFALLAGGARTALARHRTLRATVQWSHDLLDVDEQRLFAAAGVFAGSFDLAALRAVCAPEVDAPVVGVLAGLAAKSMVVVSGEATTVRRYRLLDTLRAFAREQQLLLDPGLPARLRLRHRGYYADLADGLEGELHSHGRRAAHAALARERDELRAASASALADADAVVALRLVAAQSWHWFRRGRVGEGVQAAASAFALADARTGEPAVPPRIEAAAALGGATLHYLGGLGEQGLALARRAVRASERSGNPSTRAVGLCYLGYWQVMQGDVTAAGAWIRAAVERLGELDPWARAEVRMTHGQLLRAEGEAVAALEELDAAYAEGSACGHSWAALSARFTAAKVRLDVGQPATALQLAATTARAFIDDGDVTSTCACLLVAAAAASATGEEHAAGVLCGVVDAAGRRFGFGPDVMDVVDAAAHRARVREGLRPDELDAATREGARLDLASGVGLLERLAERHAAGRPRAARV